MKIIVSCVLFGIVLFVSIQVIRDGEPPANGIDEAEAVRSNNDDQDQRVASGKPRLRGVLTDVRKTTPSALEIDFDRRARKLADRDGIDYAVALHQAHELWLLDQPRTSLGVVLSGPAYRIIIRMDDDELIRVVSRLPAGILRGTVIFSNKLSDDTNWKLYDAMPESRDRTGLAARIVANNYHRRGVNDAKQAIEKIKDTSDAKRAAESLIASISVRILTLPQQIQEANELEEGPPSKSVQELTNDLKNLQESVVGLGIMTKNDLLEWNDRLPDDIRFQLQ